MLRSILCSRSYRLSHRMQLFEAVVSATALYGCVSWTLNAERRSRLVSVQRRMLRMIVGVSRLESETYVEWIQRATHWAELQYSKIGGALWTIQQKKRKWRFAGHVARAMDGRWESRLLYWRPDGGTRRVGRPVARWTDELDDFMEDRMQCDAGSWISFAQDKDAWREWESEFARS